MKAIIISASLLIAASTAANAAEVADLSGSAKALAVGHWYVSAYLSTKALAVPGLSSADTLKALNNLCISQTKTSQFDAALESCGRSVAMAPTEWSGYINRGNLRAMTGDAAGARADYAQAQALNPSSPVVRMANRAKMESTVITAPFVALAPGNTVLAKSGGVAGPATAEHE